MSIVIDFSLIVGAPKTKATATSGGVHSCPVSTGVSLLPGSKCYSYPSPPFVETNSTSLGLSLEVENSYDVMVSCVLIVILKFMLIAIQFQFKSMLGFSIYKHVIKSK